MLKKGIEARSSGGAKDQKVVVTVDLDDSIDWHRD